MSIQEAIDCLKEGIERADYPESEIMKEALALLEQAEPEPGEFSAAALEATVWLRSDIIPRVLQNGANDAADLIYRQQKEIDRLTAENKCLNDSLIKMGTVNESLCNKEEAKDEWIRQLKVENQAQAEEIHRIRPLAECYQRVCKSLGIDKDILGYVKAQAERIERLEDVPAIIVRNLNAAAVGTTWIKEFCEQALKSSGAKE